MHDPQKTPNIPSAPRATEPESHGCGPRERLFLLYMRRLNTKACIYSLLNFMLEVRCDLAILKVLFVIPVYSKIT